MFSRLALLARQLARPAVAPETGASSSSSSAPVPWSGGMWGMSSLGPPLAHGSQSRLLSASAFAARDWRNVAPTAGLYSYNGQKPLFVHQVNAESPEQALLNAESMMVGGGIDGSTGAFGGDSKYARAHPVDAQSVSSRVPSSPKMPYLIFTTKDRPASQHAGMMTGLEWRDRVRFAELWVIWPDGQTTYRNYG